jgi:type II secretory pathway component PulF
LQLEENVSNNFAELSNKEITLEVGADTYAAESSFSNLADFYSSVKNIVESNPPIVDAYGNADFSNMIAAMLEAGYTAADVAAALQSIG